MDHRRAAERSDVANRGLIRVLEPMAKKQHQLTARSSLGPVGHKPVDKRVRFHRLRSQRRPNIVCSTSALVVGDPAFHPFEKLLTPGCRQGRSSGTTTAEKEHRSRLPVGTRGVRHCTEEASRVSTSLSIVFPFEDRHETRRMSWPMRFAGIPVDGISSICVCD